MSQDEVKSSAITAILESPSFEVGAERLARQAMAFARPSMESGRILRAMVHLRPEGGYVGLVVAEADPADAQCTALAPSTTAWHIVRSTNEPVAVDVFKRSFETASGQASRRSLPRTPAGFHSQQIFIDRMTSHLLAVPLCSGSGAVVGMVSVEASCMRRTGDAWIWGEGGRMVAELAKAVGPALTVLPGAPLPPPDADELLPVSGSSMARTLTTLGRFAGLQADLLLSGPSGAGKTALVDWIVARSPRAGRPVVTYNIAGQTAERVESELFGWVRGAFTGAISERLGLVGCAEGGTLFIDEVDKCSLDAQSALLELFDQKRYRRRGEDSLRTADVRFLFATNADLLRAVDEGTLLEDLYYRIDRLSVRIPPLVERRDEIGAWATWLARREHRINTGRDDVVLQPEARAILETHGWPGNIRQLGATMTIAIALAASESPDLSPLVVTPSHLELAMPRGRVRPGRGPATVDSALREVARRIVQRARERRVDHRLLDGLKGYVIEAALDELDFRGTAELLDRAALLRGSNHRPWIQGELTRAEALREALGELSLED